MHDIATVVSRSQQLLHALLYLMSGVYCVPTCILVDLFRRVSPVHELEHNIMIPTQFITT